MVGWGVAGGEGWLVKGGRLEHQRGTNHGGWGGLADGKPRAAERKDAADVCCEQRPRGDCGGAFEGGGGHGGEGRGEEGGAENLAHESPKLVIRSSPIAEPFPLSTQKPLISRISNAEALQPEILHPRPQTRCTLFRNVVNPEPSNPRSLYLNANAERRNPDSERFRSSVSVRHGRDSNLCV